MALIEREVVVAVAATATALSPRARETVRKGAVYGLAGVLRAGDVVVAGMRGAAQGAAQGFSSSGNGGGRQAAGTEQAAGTAPAAGTEPETATEAAAGEPRPTRRRRAATT